jgi:hypothetical protein
MRLRNSRLISADVILCAGLQRLGVGRVRSMPPVQASRRVWPVGINPGAIVAEAKSDRTGLRPSSVLPRVFAVRRELKPVVHRRRGARTSPNRAQSWFFASGQIALWLSIPRVVHSCGDRLVGGAVWNITQPAQRIRFVRFVERLPWGGRAAMASSPQHKAASPDWIAVGRPAITAVLPPQSEAATQCWSVALRCVAHSDAAKAQ